MGPPVLGQFYFIFKSKRLMKFKDCKQELYVLRNSNCKQEVSLLRICFISCGHVAIHFLTLCAFARERGGNGSAPISAAKCFGFVHLF